MPGLKSRTFVSAKVRSPSATRGRLGAVLFVQLAWLAAAILPGSPLVPAAQAGEARGTVYFSLADFCLVLSYKDGAGMEIAQLTGGGVVPAQDKGTHVTYEEDRPGLMGFLGGLDHTKRTGIFRYNLPPGNYVIHNMTCSQHDKITTFGVVSKEKRSIWESLTKGPAPVDPRAGIGYFTVAANEVANAGALNVANSTTLTVRPLNAVEISDIKQVYPAEAKRLVYRPVMQLPQFIVSAAAGGGKALPAEAATAWNAIKDSNELAKLDAFRKKYGRANPLYDDLAKKRIEALKAASPGLETKSPFNMASSPKAIRAGRGVGSLSIGMSQEQIRGLLGEPGEVKEFNDGSIYLNYYGKGLSIAFNGGKASAIFAYSGRADHYGESQFTRYNGVLPAGLNMDSSLAQVTAKLGAPQADGEYEGDRWAHYDEGMSFGFDHAGLITHVSVGAPR